MKTDIDDLTEDEIGKRFPIKVVAYDDKWPTLFEGMRPIIPIFPGTHIVRNLAL